MTYALYQHSTIQFPYFNQLTFSLILLAIPINIINTKLHSLLESFIAIYNAVVNNSKVACRIHAIYECYRVAAIDEPKKMSLLTEQTL